MQTVQAGPGHKPGKDLPYSNGCDLRGGIVSSCHACHGWEWSE